MKPPKKPKKKGRVLVTYSFVELRGNRYRCCVCAAMTDDPEGHANFHEGNPVEQLDEPTRTVDVEGAP